jgi:ABC-type uncharacterized transport system involved in gliding motility auxiliary subunit
MNQKSQLLKIVISWIGPFIILVGIGAGLVSGWEPLPITLVSVGLFIMVLSLLVVVTQRRFWRQRSTQVGTNAFIATLAVVIMLTLVNLVATRQVLRLDLTDKQLYTSALQSQEVVKTLKVPVKVVVFDSTKPDTIVNTLENYHRLGGGMFTYEFVDPRAEPNLVQEFGVNAVGDMYLEAKGQKQLVQNIQQEPLSESRLTNALARLGNDRQDAIYFLQGHGEYQLSQITQATQRLQERGFLSNPLNIAERLSQGEPAIPDDATVVVVADPQRSLFEQEEKALQTYLDAGGSVLLLVEPFKEPGLDPLLKEWGVILDNRLVIDGTGGMLGVDPNTGGVVGYGPVAPLVTRYGNHPITANFSNGNSFYPLARAVEVNPPAGTEATKLLITNDQSWGESNPKERPGFDQGEDLQGPLTLGVALARPQDLPQGSEPDQTLPEPSPEAAPEPSPEASSEPSPEASPESTEVKPDSQPKKEPRFVVIGSAQFFTNGLFDQQLNGDVFTNSVVWLSQREGEVLSISPKEPTNRRIEMAAGQRNFVYLFALFVLPIVGFALALLVWFRRR